MARALDRSTRAAKVEPLSQSALVESWVARCSEFMIAEGFRYFIFGLIVPRPTGRPVQFVLTNFPQEWLKLYDQRGYIRVDPVAVRLLTSFLPFAWDEFQAGGSDEEKFWKEAEAFGLRHGFSVPVHGPRGQHAALGLSGQPTTLPPGGRQQLFERTWSFTLRLLDEVLTSYMAHDGDKSVTPLTPKQRETLTMVARGRSKKEISNALRMHTNTVDYHLKSAMARLGAENREQAIVRALLTGDIEELSYPQQLQEWCLRVGA